MSRGTDFWDQLFVVDQNLLNAGGASILLCLCFSQVVRRIVSFMVGVNKKNTKKVRLRKLYGISRVISVLFFFNEYGNMGCVFSNLKAYA